jgi:hypothetical protein
VVCKIPIRRGAASTMVTHLRGLGVLQLPRLRATRSARDRSPSCTCGGVGMPCPSCNPSDPDNPRPPAGMWVEYDKDGWRH